MPIYTVPLGDGQTVEILGPENATAEELTQAVTQISAQLAPPTVERKPPNYSFGTAASKAFSRGKKRVASTFGDVIPAMIASSLGFDEYAEKQLKEAETTQKIIQRKYRPQFESFKDVSGPIEALKFATETVAEQIPNIATTLIPGAGAGVAATRLGAAKLAASEIAKRQAVAQGVGVYLGSYALNAPEVFQNVYQETGELATGASLIFGAAAASLDAILPAAVLRKITPTQKAAIGKAVIKQSGMRPGLAEVVFKEGLKAVGAEGLTEGAQEAISISAENFVAGNPQIFQSEDWDRIMEASVRGAIAGGFLGGVAAPFTRPSVEKPAEPPQEETTTTPPATDIVEELETQPQGELDVTKPKSDQEAVGVKAPGAGTPVSVQPIEDTTEGAGEPVGERLGSDITDVSEPTGGEGVSPTPLTAQELWDNLKTGTPYNTLSGAIKDTVDIAAEQDLLDPSTKAGKDSIKEIKTLIKQDKDLPQQLEALAKKEPKEEEVATVPPVEPPVEQAPVALDETAEETWAAMSDIPFKDLNTESKDIVRMAKKDNVLNQDVVDQVEATHAKNKIADKMSEKYKDAEGIETTGAPLGTQESRVEPVDTGNTSELVSGELTQEFGPNVGRMQERGRLQIVNNVEELPENVKMSETANGAFDPSTQTSYIVANRVPAGQARRVLLHEVGEHYGLEKMVGKDYMAILNRVKSLKNTNKQVKEIYDEVEALYPELTPGSKPFLQEVVAKLGERAPNNTIMRRLIGAVKNFLRRLGLYDVNRFSDIDIQDMILNSLRASLKETTGREQVSGPALRPILESKLTPAEKARMKVLRKLYLREQDYTTIQPGDILYHGSKFAQAKGIKEADNTLLSQSPTKLEGGLMDEGNLIWFTQDKEVAKAFSAPLPRYLNRLTDQVTDIIGPLPKGSIFAYKVQRPLNLINRDKKLTDSEVNKLKEAFNMTHFTRMENGVEENVGLGTAVRRIGNKVNVPTYEVQTRSDRTETMESPWPMVLEVLGYDGFIDAEGSQIALAIGDIKTEGEIQFSKNNPPGGYQPLQYSKNFGFADSIVEKMPLPSKDYIQGVWDKILQLPTTVRKTWMGVLGLQAMADLYSKFLPSIQKLINILEQRAANVETTRGEVDVLGNLGMDIIQGKERKLMKYNAKEVKLTLNKDGSVAMNDQTTKVKYTDKQLGDWETTVYELSRQNIDPRDQGIKNQAEPLVQKFRRLPAELQALAIAFTTKYEQYGDSLIKAFVKNVGTDPAAQAQANIVIKEFQNNRLKFYHPFRRQGDYRLEYVSKADLQNYEASIENVTDEKALAEADRAYQQLKTVKRFETKNEYLRALQELQANDTLELLNGGVDPVSQRGDMTVGAVQVMDKVLAVLSKKDATTNEQKVDPKTVEQVRQIFLDLLPAQSIKQQTRRRVGTKGEIQDLVGGFIDLGARMATQIANLDYIPQIDQTINEIKQERAVAREATLADTTMTNEQKTRLDESLAYAVEEISGPAARSFFHNPVAGPISSRFAYLSYMTTIAGNVSSAIVNASQLAIIVYPSLVAKYGFTAANKAMGQAFRYYFGGGKDSNRGFLPDHSFGMKNGKLNEALPNDIKQLYEQGIRNTVFRRGVGYELTEMRKTNAKDFIGMKAKFDALMGWMFQNTERMNREVTYLAGYIAAKDKGDSFVDAEAYARDLTRRSHGTALPEVGPRYFQTGFGKVMFTFKRYGHAMMHLLIKGMYDAYKGESKEVRSMARKQILGIYGASFTFAGLQGVPLYGATQVVAESLYALLGDDDEPFDFEESTREIFGDIGYRGPLNKLLNLDIASRTGFANLIWREDPRRVSEVGVLQYAAEQTLGPSFSYFLSVNRGLGDMSNGNMYRGLEQMLPAFLRNPMKAVRYGTEGALTRKGAELTELNGLDAFLQVFGFTNEDLSLQYARNQSMKAAERSFNARRSGLLTAHFLARQNGDMEMLREIDGKISDFNRSTLGRSNPITSDTLTRSFRERLRSIEESTNGITLSKRTADVIKKEYGS